MVFSEKQKRVLGWWTRGSAERGRDALICDGAVRSGKTYCLSLGFMLWAMTDFDGCDFAFCGKTAGALRRNVTDPLCARLRGLGYTVRENRARGYIDVAGKRRKNRFYLFGGRDEGSAALIQGATLSGVLFDEAALMPRSFVEQALARCSDERARFWFSCNPEHPQHWFYTEWILQAHEKSALYLHFTMRDNPSLSEAVLRRYERLYAGTFYDRFVLGKWTAAQGAVYPMFDPAVHVVEHAPQCGRFYISCDYGTVNPASFGLWGESGGVWYRIAEYYHDSRRTGEVKTDEQYYEALAALAAAVRARYLGRAALRPAGRGHRLPRRRAPFRPAPCPRDRPRPARP